MHSSFWSSLSYAVFPAPVLLSLMGLEGQVAMWAIILGVVLLPYLMVGPGYELSLIRLAEKWWRAEKEEVNGRGNGRS